MGFAEDVYRLASQVSNRKDHCKGNEELTKHSLILPFFQMLGYDTHDPTVLVPEYKAGFASNKEKIDYAIFLKGVPVLFVEAKAIGEKLENYDAQLAKYFNSTLGLKLAVITNGVRYRFFTDLKEPNILDPDPFFEFNLETITTEEIKTLEDFQADSFNPSELVTKAENLVYLRALKRKFRSLFREPSDEFIRFMAGDIFPRKITANALERLSPLVREAMSAVLVEMVSVGLSQEIAKIEESTVTVPEAQPEEESKAAPVTTEEELAAFQAIYRMVADDCGEDSKITHRDTAQYFGIQVDKRTRWFARLFFNGAQKYVVIRIPAAQATALLGTEAQAENYAGAPDSCRVNVSGLNDLSRLKAGFVAAYKLVTAAEVTA
jgi:hypothetical protein